MSTAGRLLGPGKDLYRAQGTDCEVSVDRHGIHLRLADGRTASVSLPSAGLLGLAGEIVLLFGDLAKTEVKSALLLLERLAMEHL